MPSESTDWLVMVYISADGLLANFAVESLKQLKRAAGDGVKVVAQFNTDGIIPAKRYFFEKPGDNSPLSDSEREQPAVPPQAGPPDPEDLRRFIDAAMRKDPQAKHHALFLWGHGPEFLSDEDPISVTGDASKQTASVQPKYLTLSQLRKALGETQLASQEPKKKIDILGLDACSMCMAELASELGDYVQFMVASQDDVPDMSFPYAAILPRLRKLDSAEEASKMISDVYGKSYADYIANPRTGVRAITMSAVALDKKIMDDVITPLTSLAGLLLELSKKEDTRGEILTARQKSQGFVFGLFVDIVDLCDKLKATNSGLNTVCDKLQATVRAAVIKNETHKNPPDEDAKAGKVQGIHGLSIYFPYRVPDLTEQLQELRKGGGPFLSKGGSNFPSKERAQRIHELERDFAELKDTWVKTGWTTFIQEGWSSILANEAKAQHLVLDDIYSAQQCAQNLGSVRQSGNEGATLDRQQPVTPYSKGSVVEMPGSSKQPPAINQ